MQNHQPPFIDSNDALDREDAIEMLRLSADHTSALLSMAMNDEIDTKPTPRFIKEANYLISEQLRIAKRLAANRHPDDVALQAGATCQVNRWVHPICGWRKSECKRGVMGGE
ncbi:hypothetical protein [Candidatus Thiodiazotropha sp. CDECU1]|uniref:hypothetical protein n=1 Tax=Candidatus Thiodiazotropha sp. CDECU1 TaxID=3065865 RepID=UPI00292D99A0|nr:hypothetical protein [Candidatus Thiodiazotropha sp. CDECU1]